MRSVLDILQSEAGVNLTIALLHSLWQGLVLAVILFVILQQIPAGRSNLRYRLSALSLLLVLMCAMGTFSILQYEGQTESAATVEGVLSESSGAVGPVTDSVRQESVVPMSEPIELTVRKRADDFQSQRFSWSQWVVIAWGAGVVVMLGRIFVALAGAARLRRDAVDVTDDALTALFGRLCKTMQIKRGVRFATSRLLTHPGVIGFFKPVLLIPVSILSEVSSDDLEAIIAHELAHIRRYDYLVNFCQMVIEAIFFFNPMMWWISKQIRIEREACCDLVGVATCGKPARYAQTLLDQLCRAASGGQLTAAMTGFSDDSNSASTERIKRIIHPQQKPHIKISWLKLTCWMAISLLVLATLWKTTDIAVAFAGSILSPAERIEIMTELDKTHGVPEYDPDSHGQVPEDQKATVAGVVKTFDGGKLQRYAHMKIYVTRYSSSQSIGISPTFSTTGHCAWDGNTGAFMHRNSYGVAYVSVSCPGYAPTCVGPFELQPREIKDDIEIMLNKSYPATIQIVDADTKEPIPDVTLVGGYLFRPGGGHSHTINLNTDENGLAIINDAGDVNVTFKATAAGYQETKFEDQELIKDGVVVLEMKQAEPAEGVVIAKSTGLPVAGAVIRVQQSMGRNQMSWGRDHGKISATTEDNGHFMLSQLDEQTTYVFSVKADGYSYAFTEEISAGQKNIQVQLPDEIVIPGKVIGPLDELPTEDGKPYVSYCCAFSWNNHSNVERSQKAFVTIENNAAYFEVMNVWGTHVNVGSSYWRKDVRLNEPLPDEIVLDLSEPLTADGKPYHKRNVILKFDVPEGFPPPTGTVRLDYMDPAHAHNGYKPKLVKIVDGKVQSEVTAPGKIRYEMGDTVGYWFKEKSEIKVDDSTEPLVIKIPAIPAGMIFGQVYEADGTPATGTMVSLVQVKKSPLLDKDTHFLNVDGKNSSSSTELETRYSLTPLPLGGVYRANAHRGHTYVLSDPIKVTEENPIQEVNMVMPEGITVSGQLYLPDSQPASNIPCHLSFSAKAGGSYGTNPNHTNLQGRFEFYHVNPDIEGIYRLRIECKKDFRPVELELDDISKPIELTLEAGAVVEGQFIDKETGWPIPGLEVSAYNSETVDEEYRYERVEAETKTDRNGMFRFSNMKSGRKYGLTASGCKDLSTEVKAGQTEPTKIITTLYDWSQCKPRKPDED